MGIVLVVAEHDFEILDALRVGCLSSTGAFESLVHNGRLALLDFKDSTLDSMSHLRQSQRLNRRVKRAGVLTMKCFT